MAPTLGENALKAQSLIFYKRSFPKEHVEFVVYSLMRLATDRDLWRWPIHVDYGVDVVTNALYGKFEKEYSAYEVVEVIQKLHERHCVTNRIMNEPGMKYDFVNNKFDGDDNIWEKLLGRDERCSWYFFVADPMWEDLAIIFAGYHGEYASDTVEISYGTESSDQRIMNVMRFHGFSEISNGSPKTPLVPAPSNSFSPSAGGWNLGIGSPSAQKALHFASPTLSSPGFEIGTEEAWLAGRRASAEKSAAKRKIILDFTCHSPGGSSSSTTPAEKEKKQEDIGVITVKKEK